MHWLTVHLASLIELVSLYPESPAHGASGLGSSVALSWLSNADGGLFDVAVFEAGPGASSGEGVPVASCSDAASSCVVEGLDAGVDYVWRLLDEAGRVASPMWSFGTLPVNQPRRILIQDIGNDDNPEEHDRALEGIPVDFSWIGSDPDPPMQPGGLDPEPLVYELSIGPDALGLQPVCVTLGLSCTVGGLLPGNSYVWGLLAVDGYGDPSVTLTGVLEVLGPEVMYYAKDCAEPGRLFAPKTDVCGYDFASVPLSSPTGGLSFSLTATSDHNNPAPERIGIGYCGFNYGLMVIPGETAQFFTNATISGIAGTQLLGTGSHVCGSSATPCSSFADLEHGVRGDASLTAFVVGHGPAFSIDDGLYAIMALGTPIPDGTSSDWNLDWEGCSDGFLATVDPPVEAFSSIDAELKSYSIVTTSFTSPLTIANAIVQTGNGETETFTIKHGSPILGASVAEGALGSIEFSNLPKEMVLTYEKSSDGILDAVSFDSHGSSTPSIVDLHANLPTHPGETSTGGGCGPGIAGLNGGLAEPQLDIRLSGLEALHARADLKERRIELGVQTSDGSLVVDYRRESGTDVDAVLGSLSSIDGVIDYQCGIDINLAFDGVLDATADIEGTGNVTLRHLSDYAEIMLKAMDETGDGVRAEVSARGMDNSLVRFSSETGNAFVKLINYTLYEFEYVPGAWEDFGLNVDLEGSPVNVFKGSHIVYWNFTNVPFFDTGWAFLDTDWDVHMTTRDVQEFTAEIGLHGESANPQDVPSLLLTMGAFLNEWSVVSELNIGSSWEEEYCSWSAGWFCPSLEYACNIDRAIKFGERRYEFDCLFNQQTLHKAKTWAQEDGYRLGGGRCVRGGC